MKAKSSFLIALPLLFLIIGFNSHVFAQDSTATLDSKLTGVWLTDSKDAVFAKMQFFDDGGFLGYTEAVDKNAFATGTYSVKGNVINIAANIKSSDLNNSEPVSINYVFTNYSFNKDNNKLQFSMSDRKDTFVYTKSK